MPSGHQTRSVINQQADTAKQLAADTVIADTLKNQTADSILNQPGATLKTQTVDSVLIEIPDSVLSLPRTFSAEELTRGERLFYGLAYPEDRGVRCVSCHNTRQLDTLNWNPDAFEISVKYLNKNAAELKKVLLRPAGKKMTEVHNGFQLTNEDILLIKGYMDRFVDIGIKQKKPVVTNLLLLIISSVLLFISLTDVVIKKLFRNKNINRIIIPVTSVVITWILAVNAIAFGRATNYSPDQPIKFSHAVHAGQNQTDCNLLPLFCEIQQDFGNSTRKCLSELSLPCKKRNPVRCDRDQ